MRRRPRSHKQNVHDWGEYERSVAHLYAEGNNNLDEDRQTLIREIEHTVAAGRHVPPGKYAHVGYLCYLAGDTQAAAKYLQAETHAFPESATLMDTLLGRLQ